MMVPSRGASTGLRDSWHCFRHPRNHGGDPRTLTAHRPRTGGTWVLFLRKDRLSGGEETTQKRMGCTHRSRGQSPRGFEKV